MDYAEFYRQSSKAADDIRNGTYDSAEAKSARSDAADQSLTTPLVSPRPRARPTPQAEKPNDMVVGYMGLLGDNPEPLGEGFDNRAMYNVSGPPVEGPLSAAREAIAAVESRGSGDYSAMGKVITSGMYKGDRAYGRYQVMGKNIASWTKQALGETMTPEEFLASPKAQDAVVEFQLEKSYNKYGTYEDAASVWFSGRPMSRAGNASDGDITAPQYINKFRKAFNEYSPEELLGPSISIMSPRSKTV